MNLCGLRAILYHANPKPNTNNNDNNGYEKWSIFPSQYKSLPVLIMKKTRLKKKRNLTIFISYFGCVTKSDLS